MNLADGIVLYVRRKRQNGLQFKYGEWALSTLSRFCGDADLDAINQGIVSRYLNDRPVSAVTYRLMHGILRCFFEYWVDRGAISEFQMPPNRPRGHCAFVPHIYTRDEIKRLIREARLQAAPQRRSIDPRTLQTVIIMAYATGALGGELVALRTTDVDLKRGYITFHTSRVRQIRTVPMGSDLVDVLQRYEAWKRRKGLQSENFFSRINGMPISAGRLCTILGRLRKRAGIVSSVGGSGQPRIRDLRATFAVHRLTSWIRDRRDLNRMLPALAAYLGFVELSSTDRYLFLTPERFRRGLDALSPQRSMKKWQNDPELMSFLQGL